MNKISIIIKREYLTRVRKRSFIVMTFLGPLLMASIILLPVYFSHLKDNEEEDVVVVDETGWFYQKFADQDNLHFSYSNQDLAAAKKEALKKDQLLLYIPLPVLNVPVNAELYSMDQPPQSLRTYVKMVMKQVVESKKLLAQGINPEDIKSSKVDINLVTIKVGEDGNEEKVNADVAMLLAVFSGILIYFFIFMFGSQVLRGVMEEKTNRIVEVILSSVKPFQLMMGKIIGIALVGLTQFILWIVFTLVLVIGSQGVVGTGSTETVKVQEVISNQNPMATNASANIVKQDTFNMSQINDLFSGIDLGVMVGSFLFYFLFGYLMYASLFAAIGGAIDHDADVQQFMLPVSAPLIFSVVMTSLIASQPNSTFALWLSMIPLTSPVIMMIRIPFGVPYWQLAISGSLLVLSFLLATLMAGKIYRIGILLYGKKITYGQLWKWLKNS